MLQRNTLTLLSGGAAQGLVQELSPEFHKETGYVIEGTYEAVGSIVARLRRGTAADLIILTSALIAELEQDGHAIRDSARDIGSVQTGIAVRTGAQVPDVTSAEALRLTLLKADEIYIPDPRSATAGIHFAKVLHVLGVEDQVTPRLRIFPNGSTAMRELAKTSSAQAIGCTQVTEILNTPGVVCVGPLPRSCDLATVYTAAVCRTARSPVAAEQLIRLLSSGAAAAARQRAGFT
jgi:molybdate transport system substrate-binding protein